MRNKNNVKQIKKKHMLLSFKPQFKDKILSGSKLHTIREDKQNRWKKDTKIHFATGARTKEYNQFMEGVCVSTQSIIIHHAITFARVTIDNHLTFGIHQKATGLVYASELEDFVRNDGFDSVSDFLNWFSADFSGKIIHWTDLTY